MLFTFLTQKNILYFYPSPIVFPKKLPQKKKVWAKNVLKRHLEALSKKTTVVVFHGGWTPVHIVVKKKCAETNLTKLTCCQNIQGLRNQWSCFHRVRGAAKRMVVEPRPQAGILERSNVGRRIWLESVVHSQSWSKQPSGQITIIPKPELRIFGWGIPWLFTTIWGDQPAGKVVIIWPEPCPNQQKREV